MHIVVLDGHTVNPGDLDFGALAAMGTLDVHERTPPELVVAHAIEAEAVLTNKTRLGAGELSALPRLRYIGVLATGYDVVDVAAASARGIVVTNVPAYGTQSVAQMTFALLLELCNHVALHADAARDGRWSRGADFSLQLAPSRELAGSTLGIVGLGRIGQAVARIGLAFGMRVLASQSRAEGAVLTGVARLPLVEVVRRCDVLSLHCPLTPATARLVNAELLSQLQPHALLINTSRGGLIDELALRDALAAGQLGGAALDVLSVEPPPQDHPLLSAPRCLVTPHVAWATRAARERLLHEATQNLRAFLAGVSRNAVLPQ